MKEPWTGRPSGLTATSSGAAAPEVTSEEGREAAVANLLSFLEQEDEEDSAERARYRGESITTVNRDLYVVKEEVNVPAAAASSAPRDDAEDRKLPS